MTMLYPSVTAESTFNCSKDNMIQNKRKIKRETDVAYGKFISEMFNVLLNRLKGGEGE